MTTSYFSDAFHKALWRRIQSAWLLNSEDKRLRFYVITVVRVIVLTAINKLRFKSLQKRGNILPHKWLHGCRYCCTFVGGFTRNALQFNLRPCSSRSFPRERYRLYRVSHIGKVRLKCIAIDSRCHNIRCAVAAPVFPVDNQPDGGQCRWCIVQATVGRCGARLCPGTRRVGSVEVIGYEEWARPITTWLPSKFWWLLKTLWGLLYA